jgi:hypothetical protein
VADRGLEDSKRALDEFFIDKDPFIGKNNHSAQYFASKVDRWLKRAPKFNRDNRDDLDFSHLK